MTDMMFGPAIGIMLVLGATNFLLADIASKLMRIARALENRRKDD